MPDQAAVATPAVSDSALLALYVMEMADAGSSVSIMVSDVPDAIREHILCRFVANGWTRKDNPSNRDMRGVTAPNGSYVWLWP